VRFILSLSKDKLARFFVFVWYNEIMIHQILKDLVKESLEKLKKQNILPDFTIPEIEIEHPAEEKNGDYSTNIAMRIAKIAKKSPLEIADAIVSKIPMRNSEIFERILAVQPGFINFFLSEEFLQNQVAEIFNPPKSAKGELGRVNIEFISANPTGPLHIGNGRGAFFGDVLANVLANCGFKVEREYYINDAKKSNQIQELGRTAIGEGSTYLNDYFRLKIKNQTSKIKNTIQKLKDKENIYGEIGYLVAKEIQKDSQKFIEKKLKIKFDKWFSEQKFFDAGMVEKMFERLKEKKLTYDKEGAIWLKTSEFGDEKDWVIVRSDGEPSYFLSDITYHQDKIDRGFDKIIDIWGADHQGHVGKMKAAMRILEYKGDFDALISQMVRLKTGKMSKRTGEIITLEDLIKEVGLDIARFFYLSKSLDTQMEFDLDLAKEQSEKNPVYYVQYAYARIHSILAKSKMKYQKSKIQIKNEKIYQLLNHPSELALIKQLIKFPEIIEDTAKDYQVQRLPQYAMDLATAFHQFYRDCRVLRPNQKQIKTNDKRIFAKDSFPFDKYSSNLTEARLALILATKAVLKNTLDLMGISAPEKM